MLKPTSLSSLLILCSTILYLHPAQAELTQARVTGVEDAVTLKVQLTDGSKRSLRLRGTVQPTAGEASDLAARRTGELAQGQDVTIETAGAIHDGASARVTLTDGRSLAQTLVREGVVRWDSAAASGDPVLSALEAQARKEGRGMWRTAATETAAIPQAPPSSTGNTLWMIIAGLMVCMAAGMGWLWTQARRQLRAAGPQKISEAREIQCAESIIFTPAATPTSIAQAEAIESKRFVIQDLMRNLNTFVGNLMERSDTHADKVEGYRVSIHNAMTVAGLEQIEKLLQAEISGMQLENARYREELRQANDRIMEQQNALENVQAEAKTDFLTRLPNRRAMQERLHDELLRTQRYGNAFSLLLLDIDFFKKVNDAHGHMVGDKVLQVFAHVLETNMRQTDQAGRFGGEEFMVLLPETTLQRAMMVAEKIRIAVEAAALRHERATVRVTVSIGAGEFCPAADMSIEALIERVDAALYAAKQSGRNRVVEAPMPAAAAAAV